MAAFTLCLLVFGVIGASSNVHEQPSSQVSPPAPSHFAWVDAYIDPKGTPLAAYQFELKSAEPGESITLVGVEGGQHPAFAEPPYYDPKANLQNRIVIAAFNTGDNLPSHKTRVARIMVRLTGPTPKYSAKLEVAASADGKPIDADVQLSEGAAP